MANTRLFFLNFLTMIPFKQEYMKKKIVSQFQLFLFIVPCFSAVRGHVVMALLFQDEPDEDSGPEVFQNELEEKEPGLFQDELAEKETRPPLKKVPETLMD